MATPLPLPASLKNRDAGRIRDYRANLSFYDGNQWPTTRARPSTARRLTLNYVRALVKKSASYVTAGAQVSIEPPDPALEDAAREAERALADISDANALPRLDYASEIDASVIGDGCFKVTWADDERRVIITAPDMAGVFPYPSPSDPTRYPRVAHTYTLPAADILRFWGYAAKRDPATVTEDWTDATLAIWVDNDHVLTDANRYGAIPFVIYPNEQQPKRWWGESDIPQLREAAEELNREYSRISNILELSGFPITVLSGVEQSEGIAAQAGAIWELPEGARAEALDLLKSGAITQHLAYLDAIKNVLHDLSETPRTAFGDNSRQLSGVALAVELQPLLQKVARKRTIRTAAYAHRAGLALAILDLFTGTNHSAAGQPVVNWEAPTPQDRTRDIDDETKLVLAGLTSRRSAVARLGDDDPTGELDRIAAETTPPLTRNAQPA